MNNRNLFLMVLGAGKFKVKAPKGSVSSESVLPRSWMAAFSLCAHKVEGTRELSGVFLIRTLIPFMRALPS